MLKFLKEVFRIQHEIVDLATGKRTTITDITPFDTVYETCTPEENYKRVDDLEEISFEDYMLQSKHYHGDSPDSAGVWFFIVDCADGVRRKIKI